MAKHSTITFIDYTCHKEGIYSQVIFKLFLLIKCSTPTNISMCFPHLWMRCNFESTYKRAHSFTHDITQSKLNCFMHSNLICNIVISNITSVSSKILITILGGYWINLGPLLYHFSDQPREKSIEPSYELLRGIITGLGFKILVCTNFLLLV